MGPEPVGRFSVPAAHPCLPGHFPGRPVVPGAVLLDEVISLVEAFAGGVVNGVPNAKFVAVVSPGDDVEVLFTAATGAFFCQVNSVTVVRGLVRIAP